MILLRGVIVALLTALPALAQDESLFDESLYTRTRLVTDLTGSAYNGRALLVYGEGGVIMRSTDWGATWDQIDLPDSLHILGIAAAGRRFLGLCYRGFAIRSDDDGRSWQLRPLEDTLEFWRFVAQNGRYYGLATTQLVEFDTAMAVANRYVLDPPDSSHCLAISGTRAVYSPGRGKLAILDLGSRQLRVLELSTLSGCSSCREITDLAADQQGRVYFVTNKWNNLYVLQLDNATISGPIVVPQLPQIPGKIHVRNGKCYALFTSQVPLYGYNTFRYVQCNVDNLTIQDLITTPIERYTRGEFISDIAAHSGDTLVAVGPYKLILLSFNGGAQWYLRSHMEDAPLRLVGESGKKIRCARSGILCFSNDSGRTWLTQPTVPSQVYYRSFSSSSWTDYYSLDTCWIVVWSYSSDAPLVLYDSCLISYDGGNTLQWTYRPYANTLILNLSPFRWKNSYNIFAYWKAPPAPRETPIPWTVLSFSLNGKLQYDKQQNVKLRNIVLYDIIEDGDSLYAIGRDSITPPGGCTIYSSGDGGRHWQMIARIDAGPLGGTKFEEKLKLTKIGRNFFYTTRDSMTNATIVLRYNETNGKVTLLFPVDTTLIYSLTPVTRWRNGGVVIRYRVLGRNQMFIERMYCDDLDADSLVWNPLPKRRFYYHQASPLSVDSTYYALVYDTTSRYAKFAFYRFSKNAALSIQPNQQSGKSASLWLSPPVPMPATERATVTLNFDRPTAWEQIAIELYTMQGEHVAVPVELRPMGDYAANVEVDLSRLSAGAYMIVANTGSQRIGRALLVVR